eukprot:CAMPEP_0171179124 /NCGR_PEP_ID=MMETSP0790-20130122/13098_1 /TAXON_ID=2925 /ORGANISM="Alexandrium catenella, Strain OF101" /LENGTH=159 /DNA_ID=CAMNT_0011644053 /DNA_START=74 /DNA_END=553 /DNA_ORIENTATION=+
MTVQNKLVYARIMRSEEELREAAKSGSPTRIQAVCKRAVIAGVSQTSIEAALEVAEKLLAGGQASALEAAIEQVSADMDTALSRARRLRAEQDLDGVHDLSPKQVEAACKRAEIAGVASDKIEAAREAGRQLLTAEKAETASTSEPAEHVPEISDSPGP